MKVTIAKNGDVVYRRGLKTLIKNINAEVDDKIFDAEASFFQTIRCVIFSETAINFLTVAFVLTVMAFLVCAFVRDFRIYMSATVKISSIAIFVFTALLVCRSCFWKIF